MRIAGTYPMLFAFFGSDDALRREAIERQVAAARAVGADGVAVLGLGTEVAKLGRAERAAVLEWTVAASGDLPVAATIAETNLVDMIEAARAAERAGVAWLIFQPPRPPASGADLIDWFAAAASAVDCPVAIQNAPEFLGIGLTPAELAELGRRQPNVTAVKAECSAVALGTLVDALGDTMTTLNGRGGLELTDNYRAGAAGMIPGIETADLQVAVARAMAAGNEAEAEALYRRLLPAVAFAMQGIDHFVTHAKHIAALRLGLAPSARRAPGGHMTARGAAWAERLAAELGPLPV
ncbi:MULTISPECIES: dihydrodipicolinate synthase family protein [unclassified Roseitalea]|uniref:dihydrodipicolinate synthase family protein n=1 Tax=unclassified Roseitalea TaxID=2639107 RepID=UPI00273FE209|nr:MULTISPECIES: dihydrodipicolinate synthase family protein [unclassified Roseitalea]